MTKELPRPEMRPQGQEEGGGYLIEFPEFPRNQCRATLLASRLRAIKPGLTGSGRCRKAARRRPWVTGTSRSGPKLACKENLQYAFAGCARIGTGTETEEISR